MLLGVKSCTDLCSKVVVVVVVAGGTHDVGVVAVELVGQLRYQCELEGTVQAQRFTIQ